MTASRHWLQTGNLDPRELDRARRAQTQDFPDGIEQCGTDALRFALVSYTTQVCAIATPGTPACHDHQCRPFLCCFRQHVNERTDVLLLVARQWSRTTVWPAM